MKNFHEWNSENPLPSGLEHIGEMVWDACAVECAKLCRDRAREQEDTESLRIYTWADKRWKKVLEDLRNDIEDH